MFLRWWKQNIMNMVGVDITPDAIKLLKIKTDERPYIIENFQISSLPPDALNKGQLVDFSAIANVLKNMFKEGEIKSNAVAFTIPRSSAIIKNITLDSRLTAEEIETRVWMEADRHFPGLVEDIYLDFAVLGPSAQDSSQNEVMLVACRKDQIKPYLEVCKLAGLKAKIVDINSHAFERALQEMIINQPHWNTCALLNLDVGLSTFIVVQKNNLLYAQDQTFDGHRLLTQAREYLQKIDQAAAQEDEAYMQLLKETLSAHLRHTIHFFYSSRPQIGIDHVIISGDCAVLPNLALFIQREINIETTVANPFLEWTIGKNIDEKKLKKNAPLLVLCCGLALTEKEQSIKGKIK